MDTKREKGKREEKRKKKKKSSSSVLLQWIKKKKKCFFTYWIKSCQELHSASNHLFQVNADACHMMREY